MPLAGAFHADLLVSRPTLVATAAWSALANCNVGSGNCACRWSAESHGFAAPAKSYCYKSMHAVCVCVFCLRSLVTFTPVAWNHAMRANLNLSFFLIICLRITKMTAWVWGEMGPSICFVGLRNVVVTVWTGFILRSSDFWEVSCLAERLLAPPKGSCCMEFVRMGLLWENRDVTTWILWKQQAWRPCQS